MALTISSATYRYAGAAEPSLRAIDLILEPGRIVGVVGANGAGKSTLCLAAVGLAPVVVGGELLGSVEIDGRATLSTPMYELAQRVGVLFQQPDSQLSGAAPSVWEEVAFGPRNLALPLDEVVERTWEALEALDIVAIAERDPTYLARNNYEMVREGGNVRIRQRPGPGNALGNVKFLFPNSMDIYLHDTPADHLFSQSSRAFSHGCIRVERPDDLARTLLAKLTDRDPSDYDRLRRADGEQWVKLDRQIPVYILYFTAWVDPDGTTHFHEDIYKRDETLAPEAERRLSPVDVRPIALGS